MEDYVQIAAITLAACSSTKLFSNESQYFWALEPGLLQAEENTNVWKNTFTQYLHFKNANL